MSKKQEALSFALHQTINSIKRVWPYNTRIMDVIVKHDTKLCVHIYIHHEWRDKVMSMSTVIDYDIRESMVNPASEEDVLFELTLEWISDYFQSNYDYT